MNDSHSKIVEFLRRLLPHIDSDDLPQKITEGIRDLIQADNVYLLGADGLLLGNWKAKTDGWKPHQFSMDVIRKAISSPDGYCVSNLEENPSQSQIMLNILSCAAARIQIEADTIAAFYADIRHGSKRFTAADGIQFKSLADLLAVYVRHYEKQLEVETKGLSYKPQPVPNLIGETPVMRTLKDQILNYARRATRAILIYGERGTGKEIVARMLHELSDRASGPFVAVNCGAITAELFESELFGHERGAFSGAHQERKGKIRSAHRGTLFLDEIGDIPIEFQQKLLRALETKYVTPVGLDHEIGPVNFRLICATNKDLNQLIEQHRLREDFYDRISGVPITVLPLRERRADIDLLAEHFAYPKRISTEAIVLLQMVEDWSGNVRMLRNIVESARDLSDAAIIDERAILAELEKQKLVKPAFEESFAIHPEESSNADTAAATNQKKLKFLELKNRWKHKELKQEDLDQILYGMYKNERSWKKVAQNRFGLFTQKEIREFTNWVYQRQLKKEMSRTYEDFTRAAENLKDTAERL